jgi:hypothetical protein
MVPYIDGSGNIFPKAEMRNSPATMMRMDQELMLSVSFIAMVLVNVKEDFIQRMELTAS